MKGTSGALLHSGPVLLVALLIVVVLQIFLAVSNRATLETQGYLGPDSYMRMLRIEKLMQTGDWFDRISDRTNAPDGELLPWGRPLDAVLVTIAAGFSAFAGTRTAVYWAGAALGPLLALATIPVWSWGTRPFLGGGTYLMIFLLTPLAFLLSFNLNAARADHHGFLALLFIIQLCAAFRIAAGHGGKGTALLMGLVGGVAVWASVVEQISQIVFIFVLALRFLRADRTAARDIFLFAAGLAIVFSVALPLERGTTGLLEADINRLSVAHWTLAMAAAATWWGLYRYLHRYLGARRPEPSRRDRLVALSLGIGIPSGIVAVLFPAVFLGPPAAYDAEVVAFYFNNITEAQPLFPTDFRTLAKFAGSLGPAFIVMGYIARDYRNASVTHRAVYDIVLAGFAVYIPMALWVGRFTIYVEALFLVPWAMAVARIMTWSRTVAVGRRRVPVRGFAVVAAILGPLLTASVILASLPPPGRIASPSEWRAMATYLTGYAGGTTDAARKPAILFTYITKGPELAWRTPYSVVGAPYANIDSLRDTEAILRAGTDAAARRVIERRGVSLILLSAREYENDRFRDGVSGSFLSRIENGMVPDWLVPVPLPDSLAHRFTLFRVAGP